MTDRGTLEGGSTQIVQFTAGSSGGEKKKKTVNSGQRRIPDENVLPFPSPLPYRHDIL